MAHIGSFKEIGNGGLGYVCKSVSFVYYESRVR